MALITFRLSDMTVWWLGFRSCCLATNLPMHRTEEGVRLSCHTFDPVLTHCKDIGMCIFISVCILLFAGRFLTRSYV